MKLRTGFVANSSSGSYLLVGFHGWAEFENHSQRKEKEESIKRRVVFDRLKHLVNVDTDFPKEMAVNFGSKDGKKGINLYGGEEIYYIGIHAEAMIINDYKFSEMVKEFRRLVRINYDVHIPTIWCGIYYGEDGCG